MNIRRATILIIVSILIASSAVFYGLSVNEQIDIFEREFEKYMNLSTEALTFGIEFSLIEENYEALNQSIYYTQAQEDVVVSAIVDFDDNDAAINIVVPDDFNGSYDYIKNRISKDLSLMDTDTLFKITEIQSDVFNGAVIVGFTTKNIKDRINQTSLAVIFRLIVFVVIGIIIAYIFANSIVKPINLLNDVAMKIGSGDTDVRADIKKGGKDIKLLSKTFNKMLDDLDDIQKKRINELSSYNKNLQEKNEQILSSIRYARTIQQAILPTDDVFSLNNFDYFIIYKPKDIISGDFYWAERKGNNFFIAVGDCTGHGVPGAMISMMSTILLNEIVIKEKIFDPGPVLLRLDKELRKALSQSTESDSQDGLDIGLINIDLTTRKMYFSGAFRSLYEIRNGQLNDIKGNKFHIGGFSRRKNKIFETIQIDCYEDCTYYLSTDGFSDQIGKNRRKFGTKNLKSKLEEISLKDLDSQKQILETELNQFMGSEDQRDDITLMGFRV